MTKKHFELIAGIIAKIKPKAEKLITYVQIVTVLKEENPRFNEEIFRKACGL